MVPPIYIDISLRTHACTRFMKTWFTQACYIVGLYLYALKTAFHLKKNYDQTVRYCSRNCKPGAVLFHLVSSLCKISFKCANAIMASLIPVSMAARVVSHMTVSNVYVHDRPMYHMITIFLGRSTCFSERYSLIFCDEIPYHTRI